MATRLYTHPACLEHDMGAGHPERPARLEAILTALQSPEFAALEWHKAPRASLDQIARADALGRRKTRRHRADEDRDRRSLHHFEQFLGDVVGLDSFRQFFIISRQVMLWAV